MQSASVLMQSKLGAIANQSRVDQVKKSRKSVELSSKREDTWQSIV